MRLSKKAWGQKGNTGMAIGGIIELVKLSTKV